MNKQIEEIQNLVESLEETATPEQKEIIDELKEKSGIMVPCDEFVDKYRTWAPMVWIVWGLTRNQVPEIRAITTYKWRAEQYAKGVKRENEYRNKTYDRVEVECRRTNHFLAAGMMKELYKFLNYGPIVEELLDDERCPEEK